MTPNFRTIDTPVHDARDESALAVRAYTGIWALLVRWFRVPEHPPSLPTRPGELAHAFRPSGAYLRYLKFHFWIALVIIDVILTALWVAATIALVTVGLHVVAVLLAPAAIAVIVLPAIVAYIGIRLRFDTTWYVMTSRSLRVRTGIWIIRELTLTFENVQNVRLVQGPVQRWFGFASVLVETAGGGAIMTAHGQHFTAGHSALIAGVSNATGIRDLILARVAASRSAGLGDDRSVRHESASGHRAEAPRGASARQGAAVQTTAGRHGAMATAGHEKVLRSIRDELRAAVAAASQ